MDAWETDDFIGGKLCLDFANTLELFDDGKIKDKIPNIDRFAGWLEFAQNLESDDVRWSLSPKITEKTVAGAFPDIQRFRKSLYEVFHAQADCQTPPQSALSEIYASLARSTLGVEPMASNGPGEEVIITGAEGLVYPIARSAVELLLNDSYCPVKECDADDCHWVFLDSCKSKRRRWCDMKTCGNRAKARRHYQGQKECRQC